MKEYHIALITDDNYCFPTIVCIQSLINNTCANNKYVVHVCSFGLTEENIQKLKELSRDNVHVLIEKFNVVQYEEKLNQVSQKTHVSTTALIKFELPNYFVNLDKLLYIDGDIIIKENIDDLLDIELHDYYLAASYEFFRRLNNINYSFKNKFKDFYFNSGVMLLNLKRMRDEDISSKFWYYKINKAKTRLMDQESLNAVCGKNVKKLSIIWNFNPVFAKERYISEINKVYQESFKNIKQLEDMVNIIHYVGKSDKPWKYKQAYYRSYWDAALKRYDPVHELDLKAYSNKKAGFIETSKNKIRLFGIGGFLCNIINKFLNRCM